MKPTSKTPSLLAIQQTMAKYYPNCPKDMSAEIITLAQTDNYRGIDLKTALSMCARLYIRKNLTDYETLKEVDALTRNEALLIVKDEVDDILQSWRR